MWQEEGKYPNVIVELPSESTTEMDQGFKKTLYQYTFRTPDYFWFDPESLEFQGFHLVDGEYQMLTPTTEGWLQSQPLELYLGIHEGKLRFFTSEKKLVLLPEEDANQQLEQERQQLEQERQRANRLAEQLRAAGIDPEQI